MFVRRDVTLALLVTLAAACGGGGSSAPPPPAPTVTSRTPAVGATEATEAAVVVQFSEAMDPASLAAGMTVSRTGGAALAGSVTVSGITATFTPAQPLPAAASLSVTLSADVRSAAGGRLGSPVSWSFTTAHWRTMSTAGAPTQRTGHTAVWTGTEMIVWGGKPSTLTGGRYSAATDSWMPTSTTRAPVGRTGHSAVWTGTEMIIWGGFDSSGAFVTTGGRYDPVADTWRSMSSVGAPSPRSSHSAVWTGTEMIVWGGAGDLSGGRYNPATDTWSATNLSGAPHIAAYQAAVWTGTRMAVWGGVYGTTAVNTGAQYDPGMDAWTATTTTGAADPRIHHALVWSGSELLVWGGTPYIGIGASGVVYNTGGRYDPAGDSWIPTGVAGAPGGRGQPIAAWTGSKLLIWAGGCSWSMTSCSDGAFFDPATDTWTPMSSVGGNEALQPESASVWTGTELIVWGGGTAATGARFTP